ncbi:hypothetical protein P879_03720 [Paragonimus westermani]|uniref:DUF4476 domain-containing protein n=1 Tax=Paragonimus westermani TaxID=34504 RepID=A0A8T0DMF1_9TREM|nr:hypothetical protein P879_03720 [Paragonimus westermani]
MAKRSLSDGDFNRLLSILISETSENEKKFEKLYYSKGCFSGVQAATLIACFKTAPERVRVIRALERRLCRMCCAEAREILNVFQLTNHDRLFALDCIKRTLVDHETTEGIEYILNAFHFETDKKKALHILSTISMHVTQELASGGHQLYAPFGGLYSQCFPGNESLYGPIDNQLAVKEHRVKPSLPVTACTNPPPSMFVAAPSYMYNGDEDRSWYLGGGRPPLPPPIADTIITGPPKQLGEKPIDFVGSQPSYPEQDPCLSISQAGPDPLGFQAIKPLEQTDCC